jgi:hypothetical protein
VPRRLRSGMAAAVQLPSATLTPCGTPREVLGDLAATVARYFNLPDDAVLLIAHYVLATWMCDELQFLPYLWVCGSFASGKTRLLRLLQCLCRRAIVLSDITPSMLYILTHEVAGTVLLDEFEEGSRTLELRRALRAGTAPDGKIGRSGKVLTVFGPKVIASRRRPFDAALNSRAVLISIAPSAANFPSLDSEDLTAMAAQWQPRLLAFRLQNHRRIQLMPFEALAALDLRMRDIARALSVSLLGDLVLEQRLVQALEARNRDANLDRATDLDWISPTLRGSTLAGSPISAKNVSATAVTLLMKTVFCNW